MDSATATPILSLSLVGPRSDSARTFAVGVQGASIGRSRECEVRIDDPERFVSQQHARIDYADGQFWLTDQSTNGTFLNGAAAAIGHGRRAALHTGDRFRVGRFVVRTDADGSTNAQPETPAPATPTPIPEKQSSGADPLLLFTSDPHAVRSSPVRASGSAKGPDPLAAFLADLTDPAVRSGERPAPLFARGSEPTVGAASARANREIQAAPPAPAGPTSPAEKASETTAPSRSTDEVLATMAAEVAALSPALQQDVRQEEHAASSSTPEYPSPAPASPHAAGAATAALAAFWFGLGIIPRHLDRDGLVDTMAELGMTLREAADGFAELLGESPFSDNAKRNPFNAGHRGLRRYLDEHPGGMRLNEAVRDAFVRNEQRRARYRAAARAAAEQMAQNLSAPALERRFAEAVRHGWPHSRYAQMWRLFRALENELARSATAEFQSALERAAPGGATFDVLQKPSGSIR